MAVCRLLKVSPYQAKDERWPREEMATDRLQPPAGRRGGVLGHGLQARRRREDFPVYVWERRRRRRRQVPKCEWGMAWTLDDFFWWTGSPERECATARHRFFFTSNKTLSEITRIPTIFFTNEMKLYFSLLINEFTRIPTPPDGS
jgi:hypothetical protein